jgi:hypothetical protein
MRLCHLLLQGMVYVEAVPNWAIWTPVNLESDEAIQVAVFVGLVAERAQGRYIRYSFIHSPDGFDPLGNVLENVGFTCTTFVSGIFAQLGFEFVDLETWEMRPRQDSVFRTRVIAIARENDLGELADQLSEETANFRLKPSELFGSASPQPPSHQIRASHQVSEDCPKTRVEASQSEHAWANARPMSTTFA